ncbi:hypothetical protein [Methylocucumis oryzae]|uniref:hypothetical protein n=1 Tax=Methylocucumis oryzae TaxID=1632867 RepID=UPI0012FF1C09|nr:hypothetical protein [Methylocucumis oryzae]
MAVEKILEGKLVFDFDCHALKFDDSHYHRKHFIKIQNGLSAVDIMAVKHGIGYF